MHKLDLITVKTAAKVAPISDISKCYNHLLLRNIIENIDDQSGIVILSDRVYSQSVGVTDRFCLRLNVSFKSDGHTDNLLTIYVLLWTNWV